MGATTFWLLEQELKARKAVQQTAKSTDKQEGQESMILKHYLMIN